jgi:hypothetical protein
MIQLSHGITFDDAAADAAYRRATRMGLVSHYAPGLSGSPATTTRAAPAATSCSGVRPAGFVFGQSRGRK